MDPIQAVEKRLESAVDRWISNVNDTVDSLRAYMRDITRESKFMVDDYGFQANAIQMELQHSSREPVVYEFLVASTGAVAGEVAIGRRRIPVLANSPLAISIKMRVYENDQIILTTGTLEAPGAAARLFLEMTGHMYPHISD